MVTDRLKAWKPIHSTNVLANLEQLGRESLDPDRYWPNDDGATLAFMTGDHTPWTPKCQLLMVDGVYRQPGLDSGVRQTLGFGAARPGDLRRLPGGILLALCWGAGHANETRPGATLPEICLEPGCGVDLPMDPDSLFLIYVYYAHGGRGAYNESPASELHSTARSLEAAEAQARLGSAEHPGDEYAVEGGTFEPGSWENPVYKNGNRLR